MFSKFTGRPSIVTIPQVLIILAVMVVLFFTINSNRRNVAVEEVSGEKSELEEEVAAEGTRQIELQATLSFVESDDYVDSYARNESGQLLPGEKRIVPIITPGGLKPTPMPQATADPIHDARPWQAWWQLLSDSDMP